MLVGPIKKGWWTVISLAAICGLIYNMHSITTTYMSFPTNINIKVEHRTELSFPSVTICNMSPVKRSLWTNKFGSVSAPVVRRRRRRKRSGNTITSLLLLSFLWSPYGIRRPYIFSRCGFVLSSFSSSPNLSRRRLDVCHTSTHGVALV